MILIAGLGNIFLGDDGFGSAVVKELAHADLPGDVRLADFGISGMHLAYELLDDYDTAILIDATARGGSPGTVYVIQPDAENRTPVAVDAHGMQPDAVLRFVRLLGGDASRVLLIGCEPASLDEGIGLSEPVTAAVAEAARLVTEIAWQNGDVRWSNA